MSTVISNLDKSGNPTKVLTDAIGSNRFTADALTDNTINEKQTQGEK